MAKGCQRKAKRRSGSIRSIVISKGKPACSCCALPTSASTVVGTMTPRRSAPGANGPSNFMPNQVPNSSASVSARQTRARGARSRIVFSMRSVTTTDIRNLLVAIVTRQHVVWQPDGCGWLGRVGLHYSDPLLENKHPRLGGVSYSDTLLVRLCQIDEKRPETCCSANCSTARETACPGGVYSAGQVRDLAWTRPYHAGPPARQPRWGARAVSRLSPATRRSPRSLPQHVSGLNADGDLTKSNRP